MAKTYGKTNREINVKVGEEFIVALDSAGAGGYQWDAEFDTGKIELVGKKYDAPGGVGGIGKDVFNLKTTAEGQTTLRLIYKRPWESGSEETVEIQVRTEK